MSSSTGQRPRVSVLAALPAPLGRFLSLIRLDFSPRANPPAVWRTATAALIAVVVSLAADRGLAAWAVSVHHDLRGYIHFRLSDYARLTVPGVLGAAVAWPFVAYISSRPRSLYRLAAIAVTLVLWLPDLYIWVQGQPGFAVFTLAVMHLAIAIVTYEAMTRLAPMRPGVHGAR